MADEKKCCSNKPIVILLLINTLLLGGIFMKLCYMTGGMGWCPISKQGGKNFCPFTGKSMIQGSAMQTIMEQKQSIPQ